MGPFAMERRIVQWTWGGNGGWAEALAARGVAVAPFQPANAGFRVEWSPSFTERFAGTPLQPAG